MNKPNIRFPEFQDYWGKMKLGEIGRFSKGKGISKNDISHDGKIECIRYGELYTRYQETIDEVVSRTSLNEEDLVISEANDIIIPASGETQIDIATASCVLKSGIALGGDLNIIKTENNGVFLSYYLNSEKKIDIAKLAQGISVVHLYSSQLSTLNLNLPKLPEQQKIASFFTAIDKKISQLKQKKTLLEQYKKGVMQKIFSQKISFRDDNGQEFPKWEKKRLGDIGKNIIGLTYSPKNVVDNGIIVLRSSNIKDDVLDLNDQVKVDSKISEKLTIQKNDILICTRNGSQRLIGKNVLLNDVRANMTFGAFMSVFRSEMNPFLVHLFKTDIYLKQIQMNLGARINQITTGQLNKFTFNLPSIPEQTKIANFLSSIDNKINQTQTQIDKAELWKKGLLQQMFV